MTEPQSIWREFRLLHHRGVVLQEECQKLLGDNPSVQIPKADCQILEANVKQMKEVQDRLDTLATELYAHTLSKDEEKEIDKINTLAVSVNKFSGYVKNALDFYAIKERTESENRFSLFNSTAHGNVSRLSLIKSKLPKVNLPTFDGDERKFMNFKGQFLRLVHNNPEIDEEDKMFFLKSCLTGKAERLIRDILIFAENHATA